MASLPAPGDRLVGRHHHALDRGRVVEGLQGDHELRRGAVRVGDDVELGEAVDRLRVHLRHDQRHVLVVAEGRRVIDDHAAGLADARRPLLRGLAARRHQADVGVGEVVGIERLHLQDLVAEGHVLPGRAARGDAPPPRPPERRARTGCPASRGPHCPWHPRRRPCNPLLLTPLCTGAADRERRSPSGEAPQRPGPAPFSTPPRRAPRHREGGRRPAGREGPRPAPVRVVLAPAASQHESPSAGARRLAPAAVKGRRGPYHATRAAGAAPRASARLRQDLVGAPPRGLVVDRAATMSSSAPVSATRSARPAPHGLGRADEGAGQHARGLRLLVRATSRSRCRRSAAAASPRVPRSMLVKLLLGRGEQAARLGVGLGRDHVDADHRVRRGRAARRARSARDRPRAPAAARRARNATRRRRAGRASRRAARRTGSSRGSRAARSVPAPGTAWTAWPGCDGRRAAPAAPARPAGSVSAASRDRGAAPAVVRWSVPGARPSPRSMRPGIQRLQRAELLGDHQRRVVRQHDAAGADADRRGAAGDVADHDRGRRAGDAGHVVVLGEPEAPVAEAFGVAREIDAVAQGVGGRRALRHGGEVEDGKGDHEVLYVSSRWCPERSDRDGRRPLQAGAAMCRPHGSTPTIHLERRKSPRPPASRKPRFCTGARSRVRSGAAPRPPENPGTRCERFRT